MLATAGARAVGALVAALCALASLRTCGALGVPARGGRQGPAMKIEDPIVGTREITVPVLPNFASKHSLDPAKYPKARCLDGTPGAYYLSPGHNQLRNGQRKFYIFKMGGGSCGSIEDCAVRSQSMLGSSSEARGWERYMDLHSYESAPHIGLDRNQINNPLMWDWHHIFVIYCDGGYFAGSKSTPTLTWDMQELHFNGADILDAVLWDLADKYSLQEAEDVVIGGCSAGGISTYFSIDWTRAHPAMPKSARVAGFPCSGYFPLIASWWPRTKHATYDLHNTSREMQTRCLADQGSEREFRCIIPEISAHYVETPLFMWESQYDQFQLLYMGDEECWESGCAHAHAANVVKSMRALWARMPHIGGFVSSCVHHCEESELGDVENIAPIDGEFPLQAFAKWYTSYFAGVDNAASRLWYQNESFPCHRCCPQGLSGPRRTLTRGLD